MDLNVQTRPVNKKARTHTVLSLKEEEAMRNRLRTLEDIRDGKEIVQGLNYESRNMPDVEREIAHIKRVLSTQTIEPALGNERTEVENEKRRLEAELKKGMPTWKEYFNTKRKDGMAFIRLSHWISKTAKDPVYQQRIARWKHLCRRLDPKNPSASDVTQLYPE